MESWLKTRAMQRVRTAHRFPGLIEWAAERAGSDTHPSHHGDHTAAIVLLGCAYASDADRHPRGAEERLNLGGKACRRFAAAGRDAR